MKQVCLACYVTSCADISDTRLTFLLCYIFFVCVYIEADATSYSSESTFTHCFVTFSCGDE